jgi:hypothetical protein
MTTLRSGQSVNVDIPVGQALTVTAPTGSTASISNPPDVDLVQAVASGSQTVVGPFSTSRRITLACTAGGVDWGISAGVRSAGGTVGAARTLTEADNEKVIECTGTLTITVPINLPAGFNCRVIPSGTTSIASSGGTLLNGATTTLTRTAAANPIFDIVARFSAKNSYVVTGS